MKKLWFWLRLLALVALGGGVGWTLATIHSGPQSSSSSTTKITPITPPPNQTVTVTIPPDQNEPAREVGVTIPGPILDKLGPPAQTSWAKVFENIWPGVSTLLGALVGGGVTLALGLLTNSHQKRASQDARRGVIKDRSFNALAELLKTGRLVAAGANNLWSELNVATPRQGLFAELSTSFDEASRNWFAAGVAARLALPPTATQA